MLLAVDCRRMDDRLSGPEDGARLPSTMPDVKLDRSDPLPLYEQVAAELRRAIADGEAGPGERLPPAKDLAAVLGVNTNTVLRALRILRDEGLLEFRRGRGVTVAGDRRSGEVTLRARELVRFARSQGYRVDELVEIIQRA
jgi:GntR family transcriptional regulator